MATSNPHTQGVESSDSIVTRPQVNTTTPGLALVTAVFAGAGLQDSHTGVDRGTGDVTVYMPQQPQVAGKTFNEVIIDEFGRVVGGSLGTAAALSDTGVTAGTYGSPSGVSVFIVDAKGRLSGASTVAISITTSQVSNLSSWAGSNSITTLGTVVSGTWNGAVVDVTHGGTGKSTWTQYGVVYAGTLTSLAQVVPNTTATRQFLSMTGTGSSGQAPAWAALSTSDVSDLSTWSGSSSITTLGTITTGTWNGTAVDATHGGTGQASYAIGDMLVATSATTLGKLTSTTAGNVLLSGGVGALPLYGKVGLTTHVSGILPPSFGGTGTSSAPTSGQLLVGKSDGTYVPVSIAYTAPIAVTQGSGTLQISHAVSGATAGVYGSGTAIPVITVNSTGHIIDISNVPLASTGIPTLNQPIGQIVIGNGTSGLTSFSGFTYDNTATTLKIGNSHFGPNVDLEANPLNGLAIGMSIAPKQWAFGQNASNSYMNAKAGQFNVFMVDGVIKGWCNDTKWSLPTLESNLTLITGSFNLGYLTSTPGVLTVDSLGAVGSTQMLNNKVAYDAGDTPGYLPVKLQAGAGITMTLVTSGTGKTMVINSRTNSWRPVVYATGATYTVDDTDDTIVVNASSATSTNVVLPLPGSVYAGRLVTVQNVSASGTTSITSTGSIVGLTPTIASSYGKLEFQCLNNGTSFVWVCR